MIRAIRDLVYILPLEDPDKVGSLYVPDAAKQRADQGIIKYRGPGVKELRVGDHVIFSGWDGTQIVTEDEGLLISMPESFIQAVVTDEEAVMLFTLAQVNAAIERAVTKVTTVLNNGGLFDQQETVRYMREAFSSEVNDLLYTQLHF